VLLTTRQVSPPTLAQPSRGASEIAKVANYVLDEIYASDKVQYNSLLKSIGEPERVG
jgi:hypothetical protein